MDARVIVYRDQRRRTASAALLRHIETESGIDRQIAFGELEAGVADALCPEYDADFPVLAALRRGEWHGYDLPSEIEVSVPEGFAYYALDPELYRRAAAQFARAERPDRVAVIGLRAIGTTLSTIVADELRNHGCAVESWTVRPRGHPWNRELRVHARLARRWREWDGIFAVADEGPGLSGSSFASVSLYLESLGIAPERVVLFPSWLPDGSEFVSETARVRWRLHRKYCVPFEDLGLFRGARDLSAGKWRDLRGVAVSLHPSHERRKYLVDDRLYKFVGYGSYGRPALARAETLAGWIPHCGTLDRGFLSIRWLEDARPCSVTAGFLDHAARYFAFLRRHFTTGESARFEPLAEMIAVNLPQAADIASPEGAAAVALDARLFPHEWIETAFGYLKTDALDHHDDHFYPGPQDIAWDLAGFAFEWNLGPAAEAYFLECYRRASGDAPEARLPFYRLAYLAFRIGYTEMFGLPNASYKQRLENVPWMTTSRSFA